jgi:hypothetical protein
LLQLILSWTDLDTCLNAIGRERTGAWGIMLTGELFCWAERRYTIEVPLVKDSLLSLLIATNKVIKRLNIWLRTEDREGKIMILEVESHTRKVDDGFDTSLA